MSFACESTMFCFLQLPVPEMVKASQLAREAEIAKQQPVQAKQGLPSSKKAKIDKGQKDKSDIPSGSKDIVMFEPKGKPVVKGKERKQEPKRQAVTDVGVSDCSCHGGFSYCFISCNGTCIILGTDS
jgi:hypothetical protein